MENSVLHRANTRGHAHHGWLNSYHSFSFSSYYNPERMNFGVLRVLNDDTVDAGMGFGAHPHRNMEIVSIPLEGALEHQDNIGNVTTIRHGDIQVMSAGTGVQHSEYNHRKDSLVKFLQIWIIPNQQNVTPRYDQQTLKIADRHNRFQQILSPSESDEGVWIYQDAWFHLGRFDKDFKTLYTLKKEGNGVYVFVLNGNIAINQQELSDRDGYGLWDISSFDFTAHSQDAEVLLMEVPMSL
ncbi:hypothetical protein CLV98_104180 [Dyadobacter jejuensis]|uniref:Pirin N-terminal domain-containing protein n=1 Tax=Dyadobacter jejuensis TaxID=1082580 RepID=A0A316AL95_9BACT|nr:pirin family protein [Dyadobacter jejuensis]PWJ58321.1 hypothetical protein CLV98_104180 [Dyadobacter jejuensis]